MVHIPHAAKLSIAAEPDPFLQQILVDVEQPAARKYLAEFVFL